MKLIVVNNYEELSKVAAKEFSKIIKEKENAVLGLATGGSPVGMYKELIRMYEQKELNFSKTTTVNLDEYIGLNPEHNQSYRYFMNNNLFNHINIDKSNTFVPNGLAEDLEAQCKEYDQKIAELGGIDIQLLGVGNNGHIAFNEPNNELSSGTHIISLTDNTIEANARFFDIFVAKHIFVIKKSPQKKAVTRLKSLLLSIKFHLFIIPPVIQHWLS